MISSERIEELRQVEVFGGLADDQLRWFWERCEERTLEAGEVISQIGDPADNMVVLLEGELQGSNKESGSDSFIFMIEEGSVSGVLPFARMKHFMATLRAVRQSRVLLFHRDQFPALYTELPDLVPKLVNILTDRVRETAKQITQP